MLLVTPALLQQQQEEQEQERSRDQEQEQLELKKKNPELLLSDPFRVARVSNVTLQKEMRVSS